MYLKIGNEKYSCSRIRVTKESVVFFCSPEVPVPISTDVVLCSDSGVIMRTDSPDDYLRQICSDGALMLTNAPEPEPLPDPPEESDDVLPVTWSELAEAYTKGVNSVDE